MRYVRCINNQGNEASLEVGVLYQALSTTSVEDESGMIRIIDNEGEDYLYPNRWFEAVSVQALTSDMSELVTVHLNAIAKIAIRDKANAKGISMSALVRVESHKIRSYDLVKSRRGRTAVLISKKEMRVTYKPVQIPPKQSRRNYVQRNHRTNRVSV